MDMHIEKINNFIGNKKHERRSCAFGNINSDFSSLSSYKSQHPPLIYIPLGDICQEDIQGICKMSSLLQELCGYVVIVARDKIPKFSMAFGYPNARVMDGLWKIEDIFPDLKIRLSRPGIIVTVRETDYYQYEQIPVRI